MEMLAVDGEKTTLSLTTLGKQNSATECSVFKLEVFDLDEHNFVELPAVFSTQKLPVSKDSIPQQEDVSKYPHLSGIELPRIDACIGLLIGNDVPKALEPKEIRECNGQGPYAVRTMFGWTINGPLERKGNSPRTANFIRTDNELSQQFAKFCNLEFSDSVYDKDSGMSKEDLHAMSIMEQSVKLKEGPYEGPYVTRIPLEVVTKKIAEKPRAPFEVLFVHGRPGEERPRPQGATGPADTSCRRSVVSSSPSCPQSEQARQGPCRV